MSNYSKYLQIPSDSAQDLKDNQNLTEIIASLNRIKSHKLEEEERKNIDTLRKYSFYAHLDEFLDDESFKKGNFKNHKF